MRRRKRAAVAEEHPDERWLVSYSDMITVLFCTFVVLFAMSNVDQTKFEKLKDSLATGFGVVQTQKIDTAQGIIVPPEKVGDKGTLTTSTSNLDLAKKEVDKLTALKLEMESRLQAQGLSGNVQLNIDQRGLTVKLVGSQTFFLPDSPSLTSRAVEVLDTIGPTMVASTLNVSIEGHAANAVTSYPSVWELSADRAVTVLRHLVENDGEPGANIAAVGFGASQQVNDDSTEALRELNRRVDIVVLSNQPEAVRALIPDVLKAQTK